MAFSKSWTFLLSRIPILSLSLPSPSQIQGMPFLVPFSSQLYLFGIIHSSSRIPSTFVLHFLIFFFHFIIAFSFCVFFIWLLLAFFFFFFFFYFLINFLQLIIPFNWLSLSTVITIFPLSIISPPSALHSSIKFLGVIAFLLSTVIVWIRIFHRFDFCGEGNFLLLLAFKICQRLLVQLKQQLLDRNQHLWGVFYLFFSQAPWWVPNCWGSYFKGVTTLDLGTRWKLVEPINILNQLWCNADVKRWCKIAIVLLVKEKRMVICVIMCVWVVPRASIYSA